MTKLSLKIYSSDTATSKMERFMITVSGFQLLTIIKKLSILDIAAVLDPSLKMYRLRNMQIC